MSNYDRQLTAHMRAQERQWRLGYEAGLRERRRLIIVTLVVGLVIALRRYMHPGIALIWVVLFLLAIAPILAVLMVVRRAALGCRRWQSRSVMPGSDASDGMPGAGLDGTIAWIPDPDSLFDSYRVLSTSKLRQTETRRYSDGSIRTVDVRTGRSIPEP